MIMNIIFNYLYSCDGASIISDQYLDVWRVGSRGGGGVIGTERCGTEDLDNGMVLTPHKRKAVKLLSCP